MTAADTAFEGLICTGGDRVSLVGPDGSAAESVSIELVSGNFYELLGVKPFLGRLLTPDDNRIPGGHPVIVLSYNYWRKRFASDRSIAGRTVRLNTWPMTVIGVSPPGFDGLNQGWSPDAVIPVMMQSQAYQSALDSGQARTLAAAGREEIEGRTSTRQAELSLLPWCNRRTPLSFGVIHSYEISSLGGYIPG